MGKAALSSCVAFVVAVVAWEAAAFAFALSDLFLPRPSQIALYLFEATKSGDLPLATLITLRRLAIGFILGLLLGVPCGILIAYSRFASASLGVFALGMQALPSVCWIPLSLLWFGQTEGAIIFVVCMGTLWSIALAVADGAGNIPPIYERAARTMGASGFALIRKVVVPASLPAVLSGMKQGWAFAWRSLLAAEIFVTILSGFGLGHLLHYGRELHAMDQVFGIMAVIIAIGLLTDALLFGSLQRALARRWGLRTHL